MGVETLAGSSNPVDAGAVDQLRVLALDWHGRRFLVFDEVGGRQ